MFKVVALGSLAPVMTLSLLFLVALVSPLLILVTWALCIRRLVRKIPIPTLFWAELITITVPLVLAIAPIFLTHSNARPEPYLLRRTPWWLSDIPLFCALPAAFVYPQLPGYLLTSSAAIQLVALATILLSGGASIAQ